MWLIVWPVSNHRIRSHLLVRLTRLCIGETRCGLHWHVVTQLLLLSCLCFRKDAKKVQKLEAQIPYHEGRGNKDEAAKLREQVEDIWTKARQAAAF